MTKKDGEHSIDPNTFYKNVEGVYHHDKAKKKLNFIDKKKSLPQLKETIVDREEPIPQLFDSQRYKENANKKLQEFGSEVRVYNKSSYNLILSVLIGVIVIFGLFFVWGVSTDKFKTDYNCPDCNCPQAQLTCPAVEHPDCICSQNLTCPTINNSDIIDVLKNFSISINGTCGP